MKTRTCAICQGTFLEKTRAGRNHGRPRKYCDDCHSRPADLVRTTAPDGYLRVTCWCEHDLVDVETQRLRAGFTESCGRADCTAEKTKERAS